MLLCPKCGYKYPEWQKTCPRCGATSPDDAPPAANPAINRISRTHIVAAVVIILAIIAGIIFVMNMPAAPASGAPPHATGPGNQGIENMPEPLSPLPELSAVRNGEKITVTVVDGPALTGIDLFTLSLNGDAIPETLGPDPESSVTINAAPGTNTLIVVVHYSNGTSAIALDTTL